jgi:hypothetical protein
MQTVSYILSQLVDSEMLGSLSADELREMLAELDDEVVGRDDDQGDERPSAAADAAE